MSTWKIVKRGEYPEVEFTTRERAVECDHCHRIVPQRYVAYVDAARDGHHDGRAGKYAFCRDVHGSDGLVHRSCRG